MQPSTHESTENNSATHIRVPSRIRIFLYTYYIVLMGVGSSMGGIGYLSPGGITLAAGYILAGIALFILDRRRIVSFPLYLTIMISAGPAFISTLLYYIIDRP